MRRLLAILLIWLACCGFTQGNQKPPLGVQLRKTHPIAQGIKAYWILNECSGKTVMDISMNNSNGSLTGGAYWSGNKLTFDGLTGMVSTQNTKNMIAGQQLTLASWFKLNIITSSYYQLLTGSYLSGQGNYMHIYNMRVEFVSGPNGVVTSSVLVANKWYFIAVTVDSVNSIGYINGVRSLSSSVIASTKTNQPFVMSNSSEHMMGDMVQSIIWYRTLNPSEISYLNSNPYVMIESSPMSQPYLNFGSGGAPPVVVPKRRQSFIQISWWEQMMKNLGIG